MNRIRDFTAQWQISTKTIVFAVGVSGFLALILALPYILGGGTVVEVRGRVVAPYAMPSSTGDSYYMLVNLESGEKVRVPISRSLPVVPGKVVVLTTRQGARLALPGYRFSRYADERS